MGWRLLGAPSPEVAPGLSIPQVYLFTQQKVGGPTDLCRGHAPTCCSVALRSVQGPRAHLLKRGAKCRRCWQVDMGVCRRGAAPSSPLPEHLRPGREAQATHTPAVQVISGCFQSLRRTSPTTSSCTPVTLVRAVMLYGVSSVLVPKRAEEPRSLDC